MSRRIFTLLCAEAGVGLKLAGKAPTWQMNGDGAVIVRLDYGITIVLRCSGGSSDRTVATICITSNERPCVRTLALRLPACQRLLDSIHQYGEANRLQLAEL